MGRLALSAVGYLQHIIGELGHCFKNKKQNFKKEADRSLMTALHRNS